MRNVTETDRRRSRSGGSAKRQSDANGAGKKSQVDQSRGADSARSTSCQLARVATICTH